MTTAAQINFSDEPRPGWGIRPASCSACGNEPSGDSECVRHYKCGSAYDAVFHKFIVACPAAHAIAVELLATLQDAVQFVAKWANDHDSQIGFRMVERMEAAIAKARAVGADLRRSPR